jgi:hypothetical protein
MTFRGFQLKQSWTRLVAWVERGGESIVREPVASLLFLGAALLAFGYAAAALGLRLWYEAQGPYNVDTPLYWTIGHAILKGFVPYRDLYETKPPGIFLLSALSYLVTGDGRLTNATQVAALALLALSPLPFVLRLGRTRGRLLPAIPVCVALWTIVLVLAAYVEERSGEVQVETHALAGMVGYMLLIGVPGRWAFRSRVLAIIVAIGMKEPFLLLLPAVYLVMEPEARWVWRDLLGPLLLAGLVGTLLLLAAGWLPAFLGIYLPSMVGAHVHVFGSPFARGLAFGMIWDDLRAFSLHLPMTLLACAGIYLVAPRPADLVPRELGARRFQSLFLGILLAGLAVGMGGHFYTHHYVCAVPLYLAVLYSLLSRLRATASAPIWVRALIIPLAMALALIPDWVPFKVFQQRARHAHEVDRAARESAQIIDAVLDRLQVSRYLWLGPSGYPPFTYTRHVPLGPLFFQQIAFFEGRYPWFVSEFRQRLDEAKLVVFGEHMTGPLDGEVKAKLASEFEPLPEHLIPLGKKCQYPMFIRKGVPIP